MRRALKLLIVALAAIGAGDKAVQGADDAVKPITVLIVTGDNVSAHNWKETSAFLHDFLSEGGRIKVDTTTTPGKDLTDANLAKYDVLLLNYRDTAQGGPETKWSDDNKKAYLKAIKDDGKGLVVYHFSSAAFANPNWKEYEQAVAGGWRTQGYHGPAHEFRVKTTVVKHPITEGLTTRDFSHVSDELYSASMRTRNSLVLVTAYCDPEKPQGTGIDEPVVWVNHYGKGRVVENVLGHDVKALSDKPLQEIFRRCVEWAATGKVEGKSAGN